MPLHPDTTAASAVLDRDPSAAEGLAAMTAVLTADLDRGVWSPGPLEQALCCRLLLACAGDGQLTLIRLRETLWEGSIALTYTGGGRLARLLAGLCAAAERPAPDGDPAAPALAAALRLLERVAHAADAGREA